MCDFCGGENQQMNAIDDSKITFRVKLKSRRDVELFFERMLQMHLSVTEQYSKLKNIRLYVEDYINAIHNKRSISFYYRLPIGFCNDMQYVIDGEHLILTGYKTQL